MASHTLFSKTERQADIDWWCLQTNPIHGRSLDSKTLASERDRSYEYKRYHRHNRKAINEGIDEVLALLFGATAVKNGVEIGVEAKQWHNQILDDFNEGKIRCIPAFSSTKHLAYLFNCVTNIQYLQYTKSPAELQATVDVKLGIKFVSPRFREMNYLIINRYATKESIRHVIKSFMMPEYSNSKPTHELLYFFKKWIYGKLKFLKLDIDNSASKQEFDLIINHIHNLPDHKYFLMFGRRQEFTDLELLTMRSNGK